MDLASVLPYVLGAIVMYAYQRWGGKAPLPPVPIPGPAPSPVPIADREATEFLAWLVKVKAGTVRLDDQDKETLRLIKSALAETDK